MGRFFGVIPAAGRSQRMGQHKLLMPWRHGRVIDAVTAAWCGSSVAGTVCVVRGDDVELQQAVGASELELLVLEHDTADMKETIQQGITFIQHHWKPTDEDFCLIAPADLPRVSSPLLNLVIEAALRERQVVVPYFGEKSGHPVAFPWPVTEEIFKLRPDQGINALLTEDAVYRLKLDAVERIRDIDTPEDYDREFGLS